MSRAGKGQGCVVIVPVLARPGHVQPLLESIASATPGPYRVLFVADNDDIAELAALADAGADYIALSESRNYAGKINAGYRASTEPLVFSAADDVRFHPGWLDRARVRLTDQIKVVGTNDLGNPRTITGVHSTHTLFTRDYIDTEGGVIDHPGLVLWPQYPHEYCDDEFIQTAMARGRYAHAPDSIVEHLHPAWHKAEDDSTYRLGRSRSRVGRRLFMERRRLWTK